MSISDLRAWRMAITGSDLSRPPVIWLALDTGMIGC